MLIKQRLFVCKMGRIHLEHRLNVLGSWRRLQRTQRGLALLVLIVEHLHLNRLDVIQRRNRLRCLSCFKRRLRFCLKRCRRPSIATPTATWGSRGITATTPRSSGAALAPGYRCLCCGGAVQLCSLRRRPTR